MKQEILIGQTDYTVLVKIRDTAGAAKTGLTEASIDIAYARVETDNDVTTADVTPAALSALTDAHTDWGFEEVSATDHPGLYRLDIADAVFASGAWSAVVTVTGTGLDPADMEFVLVDHSPWATINKIYSDTTIIYSDTTVATSKTTQIYSDTTIIYSDTTIATSKAVQIYSDTAIATSKVVQIYSDTTVVTSKTTQIYSDTTAIHTVAAQAASKGVQIYSDTTIVTSKTTQIYSDTTAIHTQTTTASSKAVQIYSDTTIVTSKTTQLYSDTTVIASDAAHIESDVARCESKAVQIYSDTTIIYSDTTIIYSHVVVVHSETTVIQSDAALLEAAHAEPTGVPSATASPLTKLGVLYMMARNKKTVTSTKKTYYDDSEAAEFEADVSDDGSTYTESEVNAV